MHIRDQDIDLGPEIILSRIAIDLDVALEEWKMSSQVKKHLTIGPGGRSCACCFPAPGSRERKLQYRGAKRKASREAMRLESENA